jgi:hypothetical protein
MITVLLLLAILVAAVAIATVRMIALDGYGQRPTRTVSGFDNAGALTSRLG